MAKDYTNEQILLEELKKGKARAYQFLYLSSRNRLFALSFSILRDREKAKDLLQEFFTDFWDHRLYENITSSINTYLYYAVRNRSFNYRKAQRSYSILLESLKNFEQSETPQYFENDELKQEIEAAINRLSPMAKKTFTMHYLENLTHIEIARQLGISKSTVGNHISSALAQLRNELKQKL